MLNSFLVLTAEELEFKIFFTLLVKGLLELTTPNR